MTLFEKEPMTKLYQDRSLLAYKHDGFWKCMDTLRDKIDLEKFSSENKQHIATDHDNDLVFLTRLQWDIDRVERDYPQINLTATKEMMS